MLFFKSIPAGADHVNPLRKQFFPTCHLEPANNLSYTLHSWLLEPFQSWVAGFAKTAVGLHKHSEEGKREAGCYILPLLSTETAVSSHVRQSQQKLTRLSAIQQRAFKWKVPIPAPEAGQGSVPRSPARRESQAFACSVHLSKHCSWCAMQPE